MKPILFSTPMAQALLNTKIGAWPAEPIDASKPCKSQTRRVTNHQPLGHYRYDGHWKEHEGDDCHYLELLLPNGTPNETYCNIGKAPYKVGDILYVRETWCKLWELDGNDQAIEGTEKYYYAADGFNPTPFNHFPDSDGNHDAERCCPRWKPSIHMPREAARLFLEVKSVRVERLHDITEADAKAEGVEPITTPNIPGVGITFVQGYGELWIGLNAKRGYSWESNPWVFVYEFMRVKKLEKEKDGV